MQSTLSTTKQRDPRRNGPSRKSFPDTDHNSTSYVPQTKLDMTTQSTTGFCQHCNGGDVNVEEMINNKLNAKELEFLRELTRKLEQTAKMQQGVTSVEPEWRTAPTTCREIEKSFFKEHTGLPSEDPTNTLDELKAYHQLPHMIVNPISKSTQQLKQPKKPVRPQSVFASSRRTFSRGPLDSSSSQSSTDSTSIDSTSSQGSTHSRISTDSSRSGRTSTDSGFYSDSESSAIPDRGQKRKQEEISQLLKEESSCSPGCKCRLLSRGNTEPDLSWPFSNLHDFSNYPDNSLFGMSLRESRCKRKLNLTQYKEREALKKSMGRWTTKVNPLQFRPGIRKSSSAPNSPRRQPAESSRPRRKSLGDGALDVKTSDVKMTSSFHSCFPGSWNATPPTQTVRKQGVKEARTMTPTKMATIPEVDPATLIENPDFYHRQAVFWPSPSPVSVRRHSVPKPPPPTPTSASPKYYNPMRPYWGEDVPSKRKKFNSSTSPDEAPRVNKVLDMETESESGSRSSAPQGTPEKPDLMKKQVRLDCSLEVLVGSSPDREMLEVVNDDKSRNEGTNETLEKTSHSDQKTDPSPKNDDFEQDAVDLDQSIPELVIDLREEIKPEEIAALSAELEEIAALSTQVLSHVSESATPIQSDDVMVMDTEEVVDVPDSDDCKSDTTASSGSPVSSGSSASSGSPKSVASDGFATWPLDGACVVEEKATTCAEEPNNVSRDMDGPKNSGAPETENDVTAPGSTKMAAPLKEDAKLDNLVFHILNKTSLHLALESLRKMCAGEKRVLLLNLVDESTVNEKALKPGSDSIPENVAKVDDVQVIRSVDSSSTQRTTSGISFSRVSNTSVEGKTIGLLSGFGTKRIDLEKFNLILEEFGFKVTHATFITHSSLMDTVSEAMRTLPQPHVSIVSPEKDTCASRQTEDKNPPCFAPAWNGVPVSGTTPVAAPGFPGAWQQQSTPGYQMAPAHHPWGLFPPPMQSAVIPPHAPLVLPSGHFDFLTGTFCPTGQSVAGHQMRAHVTGPHRHQAPPPLAPPHYSYGTPGVYTQPPVQYNMPQYVPDLNVPPPAGPWTRL